MLLLSLCFFFFNDTATTEIYTLSLHDALPISRRWVGPRRSAGQPFGGRYRRRAPQNRGWPCTSHAWYPDIRCRSEEHTSELQSRLHLVCRLLLEKKKSITCTIMRRLDIRLATH